MVGKGPAPCGPIPSPPGTVLNERQCPKRLPVLAGTGHSQIQNRPVAPMPENLGIRSYRGHSLRQMGPLRLDAIASPVCHRHAGPLHRDLYGDLRLSRFARPLPRIRQAVAQADPAKTINEVVPADTNAHGKVSPEPWRRASAPEKLTLFVARLNCRIARHNHSDKVNPQCAYKRGNTSDAPVRVAS